MLALEEKNNLSNELAATKKKLEELGGQKVKLKNRPGSGYFNLIRNELKG